MKFATINYHQLLNQAIMKNLTSKLLLLGFLFAISFSCQNEEVEAELNEVVRKEKPVSQLQDYSSEVMVPTSEPYTEGSWKMLAIMPHARLFGIESNNPKATEMLSLYEKARNAESPINVEFAESSNHDFYIITNIREVSPEENRDWQQAQAKPKAELRGYSHYLSNYQTAVNIFNHMRNLSCGSFGTQGCIPFSYVRDGCYARAHIMKKLMEERFGVTCKKIVTIGLNQRQTLNVYSSQGCCVSWSWHIAPYVLVYENGQWLDYVIDPSMFTRPVRASQWMAAQANKNCNSLAQVGNAKIFSGDVYAIDPISGAVDYDYYYTKTYQTLRNYSTKRGCY